MVFILIAIAHINHSRRLGPVGAGASRPPPPAAASALPPAALAAAPAPASRAAAAGRPPRVTPRGARTFARGRSPGGRRCCGAALSGASRPPREQQSPTPPGSDQQLYHHQRTRLPSESAAESPVSDRGTPASRTDTQRERKMWRRQLEDAGGAERLQVETANPWLPCAQQARGDLPGQRHALASNLRHTKGQRGPRPP